MIHISLGSEAAPPPLSGGELVIECACGCKRDGALVCLVWWWRTRRAPLFWLAAFLLGLGLTAKFLFLWFIVAIAVVWPVKVSTIGKPTRSGGSPSSPDSIIIPAVA